MASCSATFCTMQVFLKFNIKHSSICADWNQFRLIWRTKWAALSVCMIVCSPPLWVCLQLESIARLPYSICRRHLTFCRTRLALCSQRFLESLLEKISLVSVMLYRESKLLIRLLRNKENLLLKMKCKSLIQVLCRPQHEQTIVLTN